MAGIYIHIPFCKQKCNYCNFHFSTSMRYANDMVNSICQELFLRKNELENETINTIYFGGGTPTILENFQIEKILNTAFINYNISNVPEITIEGNPDDFSKEKIQALYGLNFNRLSIGVQSFFDNDLKYMNRAHNGYEANQSIFLAQAQGFENISIDLIYGVPTCSNHQWIKNLQKAFTLNVNHISAYALTVEEKTPLEHFIKKRKLKNVDEIHQAEQFDILTEKSKQQNFIQYEISNFGKKNFFSKHNTNYWKGIKYLGIGASAHSFDGTNRSFNIANNLKYIDYLNNNELPSTIEKLTSNDKFNEYIMTSLRTIWGINIDYIMQHFGDKYKIHLETNIKVFLDNKLIIKNNTIYTITSKGKFLCDGIAAQLFKID